MDIQGQEGREEHLIDIQQASKMGCWIMIPTLLFYSVPFVLIWWDSFGTEYFNSMLDIDLPYIVYLVLAVVILVAGVVVHELIHGMFWAMFAKQGWRSIQFGVIKEHLTPYCHCREPLRVKHYIVGALMPLLLLGVFPAIYSWVVGSIPLLLFGTFFTVTAIGDIMVFNLVRKLPKDAFVQDHPNEAGFYVYR